MHRRWLAELVFAHPARHLALEEMLQRIERAEAPVGGDQYGEDPSAGPRQERVAALLGKEPALFVPSGTMANPIGLKLGASRNLAV